MKKVIEYQNWSTQIFEGFYESHLYHSDSVYDMSYSEPTPPDGYEYDICDWDGFCTEVGEKAVSLIWNAVPDEDGIITDMKFTGISSPRFYNYSTDRICADVEVDYEKLCEYCLKTHRLEFDEYLSENFSDRSGFWSFVANNVIGFEDKLEEESEKYDQVMLEYYLLNLDYMKDSEHDFSEYQRDLYDFAYNQLWDRLCLEKDGKFYSYTVNDETETVKVLGEIK